MTFCRHVIQILLLWVQFIVTKEGERKAVDFQSHQTYFQHLPHVFLNSYFSLKINSLWLKGSKAYSYTVWYTTAWSYCQKSIKISPCRFPVPADLQPDLNICTTPLLSSQPITRSVSDVFVPNYFISANRLSESPAIVCWRKKVVNLQGRHWLDLKTAFVYKHHTFESSGRGLQCILDIL